MSTGKTYSLEFQREVVDFASTSDLPVPQVAKDFGIAPSTLRTWIKKFGDSPSSASNDDASLREARKHIHRLEQENEILRRAAAYFSQASLPK